MSSSPASVSGSDEVVDSAMNRAKPAMAEFESLSVGELLQRAARGVENFDARVFHLADEQLDQAFLPDVGVGRWPVRALLGHLADAEMVFAHRMRRIVAEDSPVLHVWDEEAFIDAGIYGSGPVRPGMPPPDIGGFVATVYTLRSWMCQWLSSLDAPAWSRRGMHPQRGEQTLRRVMEYNAWHLEHHAWYLNAKVERFLGPMPVSAGCGEGCACEASGEKKGGECCGGGGGCCKG